MTERDAEKIEKHFDSIAEDWDMYYADTREQVIVRNLNRSFFGEDRTVLDVACGTGVMIPYLQKYYPREIVCCDISLKMLKEAQKKYAAPNIEFVHSDFYDLEVYDGMIR